MNTKNILKNVSVALAFAAITSPVYAVGNLEVELRQAKNAVLTVDPLRSGELELVLKNTGNQVIEVMQEDLPYIAKKTGSTGPKFLVSTDGEVAQFTGPIVDYHDKNVTTESIAPGRIKILRFNIYRAYSMKPGRDYKIAFQSPIRYLDRPSNAFSIAKRLDLLPAMKTANVAPLTISTPINLKAAPASVSRSMDEPDACDATQISQFNAAKSMAESLAYDAASHVNSLYSYTPGPGGTMVGHFAGSPRYNMWFGNHGTPFDPTNMNPVNNEINTAFFIIRFRISDDQSSPKPIMTATCQCDASDLAPPATPANTMAWVNVGGHYVVNTCPPFWAAPNIPSVRDENSRVGTIIHETVHFSDPYWAGSANHYATTYTEAQNLAIANRAQASKNPNTYKFFILNQNW